MMRWRSAACLAVASAAAFASAPGAAGWTWAASFTVLLAAVFAVDDMAAQRCARRLGVTFLRASATGWYREEPLWDGEPARRWFLRVWCVGGLLTVALSAMSRVMR